MSAAEYFKLIDSPIVTEKTARQTEKHKQFAFRVDPKATKKQIKVAIENFFEVKVKSINTVSIKGKRKRFKDRMGKRKDIKKAYVSLEEGHDINYAE